MKLSVWAKQKGITYQAAWKWWKVGKLLQRLNLPLPNQPKIIENVVQKMAV
jgi:hypothetical protein